MTKRTPAPAWAQPQPDSASEKQISFIKDLRDDRALTDEQKLWLNNQLESGITKSRASEIIERLLKLDKLGNQQGNVSNLPDIPQGRYAVPNEDGELRFYHLDRPTEGRWAGYVFLSVRASDERHPIKAHAAKLAIMNKIAEDPVGAAETFGREIGECGICGRTLTNEESRARGIGPICATKYGW